jgi:hypothetical protein
MKTITNINNENLIKERPEFGMPKGGIINH